MLAVIRKTKQFLPQKEIALDSGVSVKSVGIFQNEVRCAEMKRVAIDEPVKVSGLVKLYAAASQLFFLVLGIWSIPWKIP